MRKESELSKHKVVDLGDQPAAPQVLLVSKDRQTTYNGLPITVTETNAFRVDGIETDSFELVSGYRNGSAVVRFSPDHSFLLVDASYLEVYTVAEAREVARQDIADWVRTAKDQAQVYKAASEGTITPPLHVHETAQPEDPGAELEERWPNPPFKPESKPFDSEKWLDDMDFGDEGAK